MVTLNGAAYVMPREAFLDVVLRLFERVAHELQRRGVVEVLDRKDRIEYGLEPDTFSRFSGSMLVCRNRSKDVLLDLDQVGNIENRRDLREILADAQVF